MLPNPFYNGLKSPVFAISWKFAKGTDNLSIMEHYILDRNTFSHESRMINDECSTNGVSVALPEPKVPAKRRITVSVAPMMDQLEFSMQPPACCFVFLAPTSVYA